MRMVRTLSFCLLLLLSSLALAQNTPPKESRVSDLKWLAGHWDCEGKFASGKSISAKVSFEMILDGHWILFRHDDNPPFSYHALSEWGWDQKSDQFVSLVEDSAGGARVFYSSGWDDGKLLWEGGSLDANATHSERFEFMKLDENAFQVTYSYLKNGTWTQVDTSRCTRGKLEPEK